MATMTHPEFNANTEGIEVAKAFADSVRGKTIIVSGVNRNGIGFTTAQALASQSPARLILAGRTPAKLQACIDALKSEYPNVEYRLLEIDLSSQKSVRAAAATVLSWSDVPEVNILINSAGVAGIQQRTLSEDGIELHFATNHIGHWLFTCLIMSKLIKAAESSPKGATRIVNVSSGSPQISSFRWSDINFEKKNKDLPEAEQPQYEWMKAWGYTQDLKEETYVPIDGYNRSKVANVLFGIGANKRLFETHGILTTAVHPGVIHTELVRYFDDQTLGAIKALSDRNVYMYRSLEAGASTSLVAALDPKLRVETRDGSENIGAYLVDCQVSTTATALATSSEEAEKLWKLSEKLVKQEFSW
uniref:Ketoreductase (KR) domain-containing protein n=1 Tax=Bionectria ochroleuca TaxID=29856 RepID=A0A8H7KF29_BIOOC